MKGLFRMTLVFLKAGIREKNMSFWVLLFPQLLLLFMYMGLSGFRDSGGIALKAGVAAENPYYVILEQIDVIDLHEMNEQEAPAALEAGEIDGFVRDDLDVLINKNGTNQQILRGLMTDVKQFSALGPRAMKLINYKDGLASEKARTEDQFSIYFYSILAMFTLYGYYCSAEYTSLFQANQSTLAQRHAVSPIPKAKGVLAGFLASLVTISLSMAVMLFLTEVVLKLHLMLRWGPSLLLILGGMLFGIAWGLPFGAAKLPEWLRILSGTILTLLMAMLSGMMSMSIRQWVMLYAPWLHKINPVSLLCEGFYSVNILGRTETGLINLGILAGYALLLTLIAIALLRRQSYKEL